VDDATSTVVPEGCKVSLSGLQSSGSADKIHAGGGPGDIRECQFCGALGKVVAKSLLEAMADKRKQDV